MFMFTNTRLDVIDQQFQVSFIFSVVKDILWAAELLELKELAEVFKFKRDAKVFC